MLEFIPLMYHTIDSIPSTILAAVCDGVWATLLVPTNRTTTFNTVNTAVYTHRKHALSELKVAGPGLCGNRTKEHNLSCL